jgi:hypothetical protein
MVAYHAAYLLDAARTRRGGDGMASPGRPGTVRIDMRNRLYRLRRNARFTSGRPAWPYPDVSIEPDRETPNGPLVLATLHTGSLGLIGALLERLPGEVAVLAQGGFLPGADRHVLAVPAGDPGRRMAMTRRAAGVLQRGGFVFIAADQPAQARIATTLLDRPVPLSRGAFALARMTEAPLVPVAVRWRRGGIVLALGPPIAPAEEQEMADAFARWFDAYLRRHPREHDAYWARSRGGWRRPAAQPAASRAASAE